MIKGYSKSYQMEIWTTRMKNKSLLKDNDCLKEKVTKFVMYIYFVNV